MTCTQLTPAQKLLVESSAELRALSDAISDETDELLLLLAERLKAISLRLWDLADEVQ